MALFLYDFVGPLCQMRSEPIECYTFAVLPLLRPFWQVCLAKVMLQPLAPLLSFIGTTVCKLKQNVRWHI